MHSKITHISMKRWNDIVCISMGNFHEGNARMYTDYMLMMATRNVVHDVDNVFRFIENLILPFASRNCWCRPMR